VLGQPQELLRARLALARAAQIVIRNALTIIGVSAPERM
jgi:arginyl-tRNA synthetase